MIIHLIKVFRDYKFLQKLPPNLTRELKSSTTSKSGKESSTYSDSDNSTSPALPDFKIEEIDFKEADSYSFEVEDVIEAHNFASVVYCIIVFLTIPHTVSLINTLVFSSENLFEAPSLQRHFESSEVTTDMTSTNHVNSFLIMVSFLVLPVCYRIMYKA